MSWHAVEGTVPSLCNLLLQLFSLLTWDCDYSQIVEKIILCKLMIL